MPRMTPQMKKKIYYALGVIILIGFIIINSELTGKPKDIQSMNITEVSPSKIYKDIKFNVWEGKSVFNIKGTKFLSNAKLYINNIEIETTYGNEGLITAIVPDKLYANEGVLNLQIKAKDLIANRAEISNKVTIPVIELKKEKEDMKISSANPVSINKGQRFNIYNGKSCISLDGVNFVNGCKIYANNKELVTTFGNIKFITAIVPDEFYVKEGNMQIQVKYFDFENEIIHTSNIIEIPVK